MSEAPTPGERAYVAYVRVRYGMPADDAALTYTRSIPEERAAWEAAAQAVRADLLPTPERPAVTAAVDAGQAVREATQEEPFLYRYRLGQQVRWACEPEAVWRITYRAAHEDPAEGLQLYYGIRHAESHLLRLADESELSTEDPSHA